MTQSILLGAKVQICQNGQGVHCVKLRLVEFGQNGIELFMKEHFDFFMPLGFLLDIIQFLLLDMSQRQQDFMLDLECTWIEILLQKWFSHIMSSKTKLWAKIRCVFLLAHMILQIVLKILSKKVEKIPNIAYK